MQENQINKSRFGKDSRMYKQPVCQGHAIPQEPSVLDQAGSSLFARQG